MLTQPLITRLHFRTQAEALKALEELETMGIFADGVPFKKDHTSWKLIFAEGEFITTRVALKRMINRPSAAEIFDPTLPWENGFQPIKY